MKKEYDKTFAVPPKTVIFSNIGAVFNLDEDIRKNAYNIINPLEDDVEATLKHYEKEIMEAALSDKQYVLTRSSPLVAGSFEELLLDSGSPNFKDWKFITFLHDCEAIDAEPGTKKHIELYKRCFFLVMGKYEFIMKYTIPYGHIITVEDLKAIDDFWEAPRYARTDEELTNRKSLFPIYIYPMGRASALQRMEGLQELMA
jgi:hypothetical protein